MARLHRPHWELDHQRRSRRPADFQRYLLSENALNPRQPQKTWQVTKAAAWKNPSLGQKPLSECGKTEIISLEDTILMSELVAGGSLFQKGLGLIFDMVTKSLPSAISRPHRTPTGYLYTTSTLPTNSCICLSVTVRGWYRCGSFDCWLTATGECNAKKMSTLVDVLEGLSLERSLAFRRGCS